MKPKLSSGEETAVLRFKKELEERFNLVDFRLFGSKVTGNAAADSDIDIMVRLDKVTPDTEASIDNLAFKINLEYDCFISSLIFSNSELTEGPMDESPIYRTIMRQGIAI